MIEIRSYRRVFDLERRVYSVDRLRLNPAGVPVRGIVYFAVLLGAVAIAERVPLLGAVAGAPPWYLRDLAIPGAIATVLSVIRIEGRTFHLAAQALLRHAVGPRRIVSLERRSTSARPWRPPAIVLLPDGSDATMRRLRYTGPGAVLVTVEHERGGRVLQRGVAGVARAGSRSTLTLHQSPEAGVLDRGQVISLAPGARLLVHTRKRSRLA